MCGCYVGVKVMFLNFQFCFFGLFYMCLNVFMICPSNIWYDVILSIVWWAIIIFIMCFDFVYYYRSHSVCMFVFIVLCVIIYAFYFFSNNHLSYCKWYALYIFVIITRVILLLLCLMLSYMLSDVLSLFIRHAPKRSAALMTLSSSSA